MSDTDPSYSSRRLLYYRGKTYNLYKENPISHLSRIKNPSLLCLYITTAL